MCKVTWCNRKHILWNGYCRRHYDMLRTYGEIIDVRGPRDDNRIVVHDKYAEIIITDSKDIEQGRALIDIEDIPKIRGRHWSMNDNGYVRSYKEGTQTPLYLHRYLLQYDGELDVDHYNGNKLDNRKNNLRVVPHYINAGNKRNAKNVRKITDRRLNKPYVAEVIHNGKKVLFKYFCTYDEAINAVRETKRKYGIW